MGNCCNASTTQIETPRVPDQDQIIAKFIEAGQGHIFNAWDRLGQLEKQALLNECSQFDVKLINELFKNLVQNPVHKEENSGETAFDTVEPERVVSRDSMSPYDESICLSHGYDLIR